MKRPRLFEFHDAPFFPVMWRNFVTDFLSWFAGSFRPYEGFGGKIEECLDRTGGKVIVDLCSGSGVPAVLALREMREGAGFSLVLTDRFPHPAALRAAAGSGDAVTWCTDEVDARKVPEDLPGMLTMFTSFHHFTDDEGRQILSEAVRQRRGVAIFEYTEPNLFLWFPLLLLTPGASMLSIFFIRPFLWSRVFWTWLVPVIPMVLLWDGFVSCLRTRTPDEMLGLLTPTALEEYRWEKGRSWRGVPPRITWMVGIPRP